MVCKSIVLVLKFVIRNCYSGDINKRLYKSANDAGMRIAEYHRQPTISDSDVQNREEDSEELEARSNIKLQYVAAKLRDVTQT